MDGVTIVGHPMVQHKVALLRDKDSSVSLFRTLVREIAMLLCYEVTRDLPTKTIQVETPLAVTDAIEIAGKKLVIVPILRAGLALADGMLDLLPSARVAHLGLYRDPETLEAVEYYFKAPDDIAERLVIVVDPMLATGHSAIAAIDRLKGAGVTNLRFVCLLAARQGAEAL
ncbi:MAG: uracil phosphoribosyltransferase, partial [Sphingomonadaceae bacterium]|nr:uracil phosphoribosyltransferase [Sphingomonadaceae bacterium]